MIFDSDSFFYAISDIKNHLKIAVKYDLDGDPLSEIPRIIDKETLANHYYSAVNVYSKINKFTFVPSSEYSYGNESAFIRNSFDHHNEEIGVDFCSKEGLNIIHAYPELYIEAFKKLNADIKFRHLSLALIEGLSKDGIYVTLYKEAMIIVARKDGKFAYYNQFATASLEDRMYFIMLTFDQLNMDTQNYPLFIEGSSDLKKELCHALSDYVENFGSNVQNFPNIDFENDLGDLYLASICE